MQHPGTVVDDFYDLNQKHNTRKWELSETKKASKKVKIEMIDKIDPSLRERETTTLIVAKRQSKHQWRNKREQSINSAVVFVNVAF